MVESVSDGLKSRAQKKLTNPNFDTISNWSTLGVYDSIKPIIIIGHDVGEIIKNNITIDGGFGIGLGGSIGDFKLGAESVFRMDVIGFQFSEGKLKFGHFCR